MIEYVGEVLEEEEYHRRWGWGWDGMRWGEVGWLGEVLEEEECPLAGGVGGAGVGWT